MIESLQRTQGETAQHAGQHELALVALGNPLRTDDGVAGALLRALPQELKAKLCILDAGSYTRDLPEFLDKHNTAIIVDAVPATSEHTAPFVVNITDASSLQSVHLDSCHALSWFDELVLQRKLFTMPKRLLFVGVPVSNIDWGEGISDDVQLRLPEFVQFLYSAISENLSNA